MAYWLMKTEPSTFSLDDLRNSPGGVAPWDGVRNYQARNHMRDGMRLGDGVLIYHSSTEKRAIVGRARVAREAYPDHTAWDPNSDHFDPRSTPANPVWLMVDVAFEEAFPRPLLLDELHGVPGVADMMLLRRGMRLSVQPVTAEQFAAVLSYARGERPLPAPAKVAAAAKPKPKSAKAGGRTAARKAKPTAKSTARKKPASKSGGAKRATRAGRAKAKPGAGQRAAASRRR
jgi:predicted RNA-binding protein with PUA-like domain